MYSNIITREGGGLAAVVARLTPLAVATYLTATTEAARPSRLWQRSRGPHKRRLRPHASRPASDGAAVVVAEAHQPFEVHASRLLSYSKDS